MCALADAVARGIVVVNATQCSNGGVEQGAYATGAALNRVGVVPAGDMTPEAAFAKLQFLLASGESPDATRTMFRQSLCGEMS